MKEKIQFSKIVISICLIVAILNFIIVPILTILFNLDTTIASTMIGGSSAFLATTLVFYLKKSQAENTTKIYLSAYKEIIEMKKENGEDTDLILSSLEDNVINKIDGVIDNSLEDATSQIEIKEI